MRIWWLAPVCLLQLCVRHRGFVRLQDRKGALPEEFGATHPPARSDAVEALHKIVVKLNQHLSACHTHMVSHMGGPRRNIPRMAHPPHYPPR